jgi:glucosamine 6-phosphate synthetase-like amidotransferase/phosphosugar isomerase protein
MCGIAGVVLGDRKWKHKTLEKVRVDFANLLVHAQVRGTHASGAMVIGPKGTTYIKSDIPASKLVDSQGFWSLMDMVDGDTTAIVGHTRFATQGPASVNDNNHPIEEYPIIGVHNGMLWNDVELKKEYGTEHTPEVDSAAIFAMLRHRSAKADFLTSSTAKSSLEEVDGSFALAFTDMRRPEALFLVRHQNPLYVRCNSERKTIHFASTDSILRAAIGAPQNASIAQYPLGDDVLVRVTKESANGVPLVEQKFKALPDFYVTNSTYRGNYQTDNRRGLKAFNDDLAADEALDLEARVILDDHNITPAGMNEEEWQDIKDWVEERKRDNFVNGETPVEEEVY